MCMQLQQRESLSGARACGAGMRLTDGDHCVRGLCAGRHVPESRYQAQIGRPRPQVRGYRGSEDAGPQEGCPSWGSSGHG